MNKLISGILAIFLIISALFNVAFLKQSENEGELVVEVPDGDTIILENRQPIRLYGIDAPELGNCYSEEAKNQIDSHGQARDTLADPDVTSG